MCKGIYNSDTLYGNMDLSLPSQCFFTFSPSPLLFFILLPPHPHLAHSHTYFLYSYTYPLAYLTLLLPLWPCPYFYRCLKYNYYIN